jgi:hypothetical protein
MPLDTSIARSIKPLQVQFRDLGADYNQLAQMQAAESQNQLAQQQMQERQQLAPLRLQEQQSRAATAKIEFDDVMEAQTYVKGLMNKAAEHPEAPRDPFAAAEQMINHPSNAMVRASGEQLLKSLQVLQAYKNQRDYEASRQPGVGAPAAAPVNATAAPTVAPMNAVGPNKAMLGNRINPKLSEEDAARVMALSKTGNIDYPGERWNVNEKGNLILEPMPDNLLADKVAPAASAEPVANAMVKPISPLQDAAALLKKIQEGDDQFARGGTPAPGWKNDRDLLVKAFEQALRPGRGEGGRYLSLGAGKALDQDTGQIISADKVPAAAAAAKIVKIGPVPYTFDAEGTLVPVPIQGSLPIAAAKGGAGKAATGGVAKLKAPSGYRYDASGENLEPIPGGPADKTKEGPAKEGAATEGERKAATLLQRLQFSEAQLTEALVNNPNAAKPGVFASAVAMLSTPLANSLTPEARQRVQSAQLDILDAALTLGTGAAYTREQLEGYREAYFPQIGDKPNQIKDKQARLNNVISAAKIAAGKAAKLVPALPTPADAGAASSAMSAADAILNKGRR